MQLVQYFVFVVIPSLTYSLEMDLFKIFHKDDKIWNCMTELNEDCVNNLGRRPVEEFFKAKEIPLGDYISIEKLKNSTMEEREALEDIWDMDEIWKAGSQYVKNHALKFKVGDLEARMFQSKAKPSNVELTVEARRRGSAKSQKIYRVIIPLVIGFKITGLIIFGIVAVKFFLLKATLVANTALMVAGGIVLKKLYDHGMGMMTQHQSFLNSHQSLPNFYSQNHDFSGYGYNSIGNNGYDSASSMHSEVTDPVIPDDLHGQFSNHAIALAALNKTLMQQQFQQPMSALPKRRWSNKWHSLT